MPENTRRQPESPGRSEPAPGVVLPPTVRLAGPGRHTVMVDIADERTQGVAHSVGVDAESAPVAEPAFEQQRNVVTYPMWRTAPPRWEWDDSAIPRFGPAFQPTPPPFEAVVGQLSLGTVAVDGKIGCSDRVDAVGELPRPCGELRHRNGVRRRPGVRRDAVGAAPQQPRRPSGVAPARRGSAPPPTERARATARARRLGRPSMQLRAPRGRETADRCREAAAPRAASPPVAGSRRPGWWGRQAPRAATAGPGRLAVGRCGDGRRCHDRAAPGPARRDHRRTLMRSSSPHSSRKQHRPTGSGTYLTRPGDHTARPLRPLARLPPRRARQSMGAACRGRACSTAPGPDVGACIGATRRVWFVKLWQAMTTRRCGQAERVLREEYRQVSLWTVAKGTVAPTNTVARRRFASRSPPGWAVAEGGGVAAGMDDICNGPGEGPSFVTDPHTRHSATGCICRAVTRAIHGSDTAVAEKVHCGLTAPEPAPQNSCCSTGEE